MQSPALWQVFPNGRRWRCCQMGPAVGVVGVRSGGCRGLPRLSGHCPAPPRARCRPGSPSWQLSPHCARGQTPRGSARAWWLGGPRDSPCSWLPGRGLSPFQELHLVNLGSAFAQQWIRAALLVWRLLAVQQLHLGQRSGCEDAELQVPGRGGVHAPLLKRQPGKAEVGGEVTLNPGWCSMLWDWPSCAAWLGLEVEGCSAPGYGPSREQESRGNILYRARPGRAPPVQLWCL